MLGWSDIWIFSPRDRGLTGGPRTTDHFLTADGLECPKFMFQKVEAGKEESFPVMLPLDQDVIDRYPHPIAATYAAFLRDKEPVRRLLLLVDTVFLSLRFWAFVAVAEYTTRATFHDPFLNDLLNHQFQRPLHSVWSQFIDQSLRRFHRSQHAPCIPELAEAFRRIEGARDKQSGDVVDRFLRLRNDLAHGLTPTVTQAETAVTRHLPDARALLDELRFLGEHPLFALEREGSAARLFDLSGEHPPRDLGLFTAELLGADLEHVTFLGDPRSTTEPLVLSPLVKLDPMRVPLCFDGFEAAEGPSDEGIRGPRRVTSLLYITHGARLRDATRSACDLWQHQRTRHSTTRAVLDRNALTPYTLRELARSITNSATRDLMPPQGVRVERESDARVFARISQSPRVAAILTGPAGIGRTTFLAHTAQRLNADEESLQLAFFYRGDTFDTPDFGEFIARDACVRQVRKFVELLRVIDGVKPARVYFILDDLHLARIPVDAVSRHLREMLQSGIGYDWFRLIVSARTATVAQLPESFFQHTRKHLVLPDEIAPTRGARPTIEMPPLSAAEVEALYNHFQTAANARFEQIKGAPWARLMGNPLTLRMIVAAFGRDLDPSRDLSTHAVMDLYQNRFLAESPENLRADEEHLLARLTRILYERRRPGVARTALFEALSPEEREVSRSPSLDALLDQGVLAESWREGGAEIAFTHEPFLAWRLARSHLDDSTSAEGIRRIARDALTFPTLRDALVVALTDDTRRGTLPALAEVLRTPTADEAEKTLLYQVTLDVLEVLGTHRDSRRFADLLKNLSDSPTDTVVRALVEVSERLVTRGHKDPSVEAARQANSLAEATTVPELKALATFRLGMIARHEGRSDDARSHRDRINALLRYRRGEEATALLWQARVFLDEPATDEKTWKAAAAWFRRHDRHAECAFTLYRMGRYLRQRGKHRAAMRVVSQALEHARLCDSAGLQVDCLIQLAFMLEKLGDPEAHTHARRAGALIAATADMGRHATYHGLRAMLARDHGDPSAAIAHIERQLECCRKVGDDRIEANARQNLGIYLREAGRLTEALDSHKKARELFVKQEQRSMVALTHVLGAVIALRQGDRVRAWDELRRALELRDPKAVDVVRDARWVAWAALGDDESKRPWHRFARRTDSPSAILRAQRATFDLDAALRQGDAVKTRRILRQIDTIIARMSQRPEDWELPLLARERLLQSAGPSAPEGLLERIEASLVKWAQKASF